MTLILKLRALPDQRLDLSPLLPHLLAGKSEREIAAIELGTTKARATVGDVFTLDMGAPDTIRFEGGSEKLDRVGLGLQDGEIHVAGNVGCEAGRLMAGGRLSIRGSAGPYAGSGMSGGRLAIGGDAGERLGGPLAGEMAGMTGGLIVVAGSAAARAGDRMRRGTIIIEGDAGAYAGSRMTAGTLVVAGKAGPLPGYLQRRGTLVFGAVTDMSPGFVDCGASELVFLALLRRFVLAESLTAGKLLGQRLTRYAGDMAVLGKGEMFVGG